MNSIFVFSACTELCLSYFADSLTSNIFNQALCLPGLLKPYDCGGKVTFFISFAYSLHGKIRKKSWEERNQVFILPFQRVSVRAELLLCYTLLGLERTSWSRSHIFRSLTHRLTRVVWRLQNLSMHSLHLELHLILHPLVFQDHCSKSNILPPPLSQVTASPFSLWMQAKQKESGRHLSKNPPSHLHRWRRCWRRTCRTFCGKAESLYSRIWMFLCAASAITFLPESPHNWQMSTCPWGWFTRQYWVSLRRVDMLRVGKWG